MADGSVRVVDAARDDIAAAHLSEAGVLAWFQSEWTADQHPMAADVWVFSPDCDRVLVVEHRWRGLVPPGGRVEDGETPREAASRELREETGLDLDLGERPAFAALRSYRSDWPVTLGLSYWAIADTGTALRPEPGQPARWVPIDDEWRTFHPDDARVMRRFVAELHASEEVAR